MHGFELWMQVISLFSDFGESILGKQNTVYLDVCFAVIRDSCFLLTFNNRKRADTSVEMQNIEIIEISQILWYAYGNGMRQLNDYNVWNGFKKSKFLVNAERWD